MKGIADLFVPTPPKQGTASSSQTPIAGASKSPTVKHLGTKDLPWDQNVPVGYD
jgi:hypothetical protein